LLIEHAGRTPFTVRFHLKLEPDFDGMGVVTLKTLCRNPEYISVTRVEQV
jgi:hypothetical protein